MLSLFASLIYCSAALSATDEFATAAPPKAADHVRVLTFNLWQEGTSVEGGFEKIVDVVVASRADLVALTEVRNYGGKDLHERLLAACNAKGVSYRGVFAGGDVGLLSRFPIVETEVASDDGDAQAGPIMAYSIELPGGKAACVCVAHLDYRNYAAYLPRGYDGNSFQMIDRDGDGEPDPITRVSDIQRMDEASSRDEAVKAFLRYAKTRKRNRTPVILTGDFNEASHLDWTRATRDLWDHNGVVMPWENSKRLAKGGFIDAWREVHSDPVKRPGHTWPSSAFGKDTTTWTPRADERDRIDFVYANRAWRAVDAWLVGPNSYSLRDGTVNVLDDCPIVLHGLPWPSDHKAVLVDLEVVK